MTVSGAPCVDRESAEALVASGAATAEQVAERVGHRLVVAEGLLEAVATPRGAEKAAEFLEVDASDHDANTLRRLLAKEVRAAREVVEAFGYSRAKTGKPGTFFGKHGLERAVQHRTMNARGSGASVCAKCGALKPNAKSDCPNCGAKGVDVLSELQEVRRDGGGGAAPTLGNVPTPVRARKPLGRGRKGTGDPAQAAANDEFNKLHPRVSAGRMGGGRFMKKGEGMSSQTPNGSARVEMMQQRLGQLGHQMLTEDGKFGPQTEAAVKAFQTKYGMKPTGVVDRATLEMMRNPPPLTAHQVNAQMQSQISGKKGAAKKGTSAGGRRGRAAGTSRQGTSRQKQSGVGVGGSSGSAATRTRSSGSSRSRSSRSRKAKNPTSNLIRRGDGMSGPMSSKVQGAQQLLSDIGYELGAGGVDGRFGGATEAAVRKFQQRYGLRVDGVIGPQTMAMLRRVLRQQAQTAKDQGYLSADQQPSKSGKAPRSGKARATATRRGRRMHQASYQGGAEVAYGGIAPFLLDPDMRGTVGKEPPNLRPADDWEACKNCVFGTMTAVPVPDCRLYAWPVAPDLLCDDHQTLTPEVQRHADEYQAALREALAAMSDGRGSDVARARARADHFRRLLEDAVGKVEPVQQQKLEEVKSSAYPGLDRSPKQNWVDKAGGLPSYIERIAKHLHYEAGKPIGQSIAIAVNVVKKMCSTGDVNFPGKQNVNAGSRAEACKAVAEWEKKKIQHAAIVMETVHSIERLTVPKDSLSTAFARRTILEVEEIDRAIAEGRHEFPSVKSA